MNEKLWQDMAHELQVQDNACTAEPIFIVQQKVRLYGVDPDLCDEGEVVWMNATDDYHEVEPEEKKQLEELYQDTYNIPDKYHRTGYIEQWEFVQPFLTRKGAERYIDENRHNLKEPRIYVDSAYRNKEWQEVRKRLSVYNLAHLRTENRGEDVFAIFDGMRLGTPVYFWFEEEDAEGTVEYVIKRVVGDSKSSLWTDDRGYGVRITEELAAKCRGRVMPYDQALVLQEELRRLSRLSFDLSKEKEEARLASIAASLHLKE